MTSRARFWAAVCKGTTGRSRGSTRCRRYLYSTWASTDTSYLDATANGMVFSADRFLAPLANSPLRTHAAYVRAADQDGRVRAIRSGRRRLGSRLAGRSCQPRSIRWIFSGCRFELRLSARKRTGHAEIPTDAGFHHPSIYGAYQTVCNSRRSQGGLLASSARTRRPLYS